MFFSAFKDTSTRFLVTKKRCCVLSLLSCLAIMLPAVTAEAKTRPSKASALEMSSDSPNPDALLIEVYQNLSNNKLQAAQEK